MWGPLRLVLLLVCLSLLPGVARGEALLLHDGPMSAEADARLLAQEAFGALPGSALALEQLPALLDDRAVALLGVAEERLCEGETLTEAALARSLEEPARAAAFGDTRNSAARLATLREAVALLPCLVEVVEPETLTLLYRSWGALAGHLEREEEAIEAFVQLLSMVPSQRQARDLPESVEALFNEGSRRDSALRAVPFTVQRSALQPRRLWIDGVEVEGRQIALSPGLHLLQLTGAQGIESVLFQLDEGADAVALTPAGLAEALFEDAREGALGQTVVAALDGLARRRRVTEVWLIALDRRRAWRYRVGGGLVPVQLLSPIRQRDTFHLGVLFHLGWVNDHWLNRSIELGLVPGFELEVGSEGAAMFVLGMSFPQMGPLDVPPGRTEEDAPVGERPWDPMVAAGVRARVPALSPVAVDFSALALVQRYTKNTHGWVAGPAGGIGLCFRPLHQPRGPRGADWRPLRFALRGTFGAVRSYHQPGGAVPPIEGWLPYLRVGVSVGFAWRLEPAPRAL